MSQRAGTGRGTGRQRPGWGREGKGRRDPETDGALALDGQRPAGARSLGPCGIRAGDAAPGTRAGGAVSRLARFSSSPARGRAPRSGLGLGVSGVPSSFLPAVPGLGGGPAAGGDGGATPLFPTFFRSFWGLGGGCAALELARR